MSLIIFTILKVVRNSNSLESLLSAITIAPYLTSFLRDSSISDLIILDNEVRLIIPWERAEIKNGLDFI